MGLTIGVRLIEGSRSKKAVIIIEKRRSNTYLSRAMKVRTNKRLRRWWCHRIQDRRVMCWGQNQRWTIWRGNWYWRILHKFKIKKEEKISKNGRLWGRGHRKLLKTRWRNTINGVNNSECCLTLKALKNKGRNEKGADNIKNVTMFSSAWPFCWKV